MTPIHVLLQEKGKKESSLGWEGGKRKKCAGVLDNEKGGKKRRVSSIGPARRSGTEGKRPLPSGEEKEKVFFYEKKKRGRLSSPSLMRRKKAAASEKKKSHSLCSDG